MANVGLVLEIGGFWDQIVFLCEEISSGQFRLLVHGEDAGPFDSKINVLSLELHTSFTNNH